MRHALLLAALAGLAEAHADPLQAYAEARQRRAAQQYAQFIHRAGGTAAGEHVLWTFHVPVSPTALLTAATASGATVTAVHQCEVEGQGVLATYIGRERPLASQLSALALGTAPGPAESVASTTMAPSPSTVASRPPMSAHFCGVEVQGSQAAIQDVAKRFHDATFMIELTTSRVRLLPVNLMGNR